MSDAKHRANGMTMLPTAERVLALTFDDGPDAEFTPRVLNILRRYGTCATFFCLGAEVAANPLVAMRIVAEGHQIANHTWSHPHAADVTVSELLREVSNTSDAIAEATGERPRWFRPPFGELTDVQAAAISEAGYKVAFWTVDSLDWSGIAGPQIVANVVPALENGAIVLHHSAGNVAGIVDALPDLIEVCQRLGFRFVRLDEVS
ncbi:polysaccharide deacetylase family protein [Alicyclobacillus sp. ALC3]|uniref:polysaccharide deacetylase family protein n=1 Tax=Alicyclobacillus sp. ALC3 TaxID=2796143 RepID=UPI002378ADFE|nr:polysaccharide deacetylase family protein [Alicyclobacillus sp. ALC3]WDL95357.1 polysaccharide deacetylase family protein [Alicyclobacillus sp. ALC3]